MRNEVPEVIKKIHGVDITTEDVGLPMRSRKGCGGFFGTA